MSRKIFTPELLARIPQMVTNGLNAEQIAKSIGSTPGSVKVMCSKHNISLKRPLWSRASDDVHLKVKLGSRALALIAKRAEQNGTTVGAVASRVLEIVARDNLYDAVIDDAELALSPRATLDATHYS